MLAGISKRDPFLPSDPVLNGAHYSVAQLRPFSGDGSAASPPMRSLSAIRELEPGIHSQAADGGRTDRLQRSQLRLRPRREILRQPLIDHLEVKGDAQPRSESKIVVGFVHVLVVEAETEPIAQERNEVVTELGARPADPERVLR